MAEFHGSQIEVKIVEQYRNMRHGLEKEPRAVAFAEEAYRRIGRQPQRTIIRGGTDGSRFTELGLPTPNLSTGQHNPHSPLEWACLEEMEQAARCWRSWCSAGGRRCCRIECRQNYRGFRGWTRIRRKIKPLMNADRR